MKKATEAKTARVARMRSGQRSMLKQPGEDEEEDPPDKEPERSDLSIASLAEDLLPYLKLCLVFLTHYNSTAREHVVCLFLINRRQGKRNR